jgi:hypothetical protein
MVVVQVRAHDDVDLLRLDADSGQPREVGLVEHVPERTAGLVLLVAAAGVDQDGLAADPQEPRVHGEQDAAALRVVVVRRQPRHVAFELRVGDLRKHLLDRIGRQVGLLDAMYRCVADLEHQSLLHLRRHARPRAGHPA